MKQPMGRNLIIVVFIDVVCWKCCGGTFVRRLGPISLNALSWLVEVELVLDIGQIRAGFLD